ncbi:MAG TPA: PepSY-associated TM helix domain-containing protein [Verrucomicrobiae bacterium]
MKQKFRKALFWVHLVIGLVAGGVIAITVFTGASMAFEKQVIAWVERDVRKVKPPTADAPRLTLDELGKKLREAQPEARPASIVVSADPTEPVIYSMGRTNTVYLNPYTGEIQQPGAKKTREFFALMLRWHRWLGVNTPPGQGPGGSGGMGTNAVASAQGGSNTVATAATASTNAVAAAPAGGPGGPAGEPRPMSAREMAGTVVGISTIIFVLLSITGIYLWWPRHWSWKSLKAVSVVSFKLKGKPRDWNWHNAMGLWSAPVIVIMGFTGIVMAFHDVGDWIYKRPEGDAAKALIPTVPTPAPGTRPANHDVLLAAAQKEVPGWETITLRLSNPRQRGGGGGMQRPQGGAPGAAVAGTTVEANSTNAVVASAEERPRGEGKREGGRRKREGGNAEVAQNAEGSTNAAPAVAAATASTGGEAREGRGERGGERAKGMGGEGRGGAGGMAAAAPQPINMTVKTEAWMPLPYQLQLDPFTGDVLRKESLSDYGVRRGFRTLNRTLHTGEAFGLPGQAIALFACIGGMVLVYTGFALSFRRFRNWRNRKHDLAAKPEEKSAEAEKRAIAQPEPEVMAVPRTATE